MSTAEDIEFSALRVRAQHLAAELRLLLLTFEVALKLKVCELDLLSTYFN